MAEKPGILTVYSLMLLGAFLIGTTALILLLVRSGDLLGTSNPIALLGK